MRLPIDTTQIKFLAVSTPERVLDFETKQPKADFDGQPLFSVKLCAIADDSSEILTIKLAGQPASVSAGEFVGVKGLTAQPWDNDGRSGVSYRAEKIESASRLPRAS